MKPGLVAVLTGILALTVGVALAAAGMPLGVIVLFAAIVVAGGALSTALVDPDEPDLPERPTPLRGGARREVGYIAWSLRSSRGRVAASASTRLRAVAAHRLARLGIDLNDPAHRARAEAALGARAYRVVAAPTKQTYSALRAAIRAVDRLERPTASPSPVAPPEPARSARNTG